MKFFLNRKETSERISELKNWSSTNNSKFSDQFQSSQEICIKLLYFSALEQYGGYPLGMLPAGVSPTTSAAYAAQLNAAAAAAQAAQLQAVGAHGGLGEQR